MKLIFIIVCVCLLFSCSRQHSQEKKIDSVTTKEQDTKVDYTYSAPIEEDYPFVAKKQLESSDYESLCYYLTKDLRTLYIDIIGPLCYSSFRNNPELNDSFLSFLSSNTYDTREVLSNLFGLLIIDLAFDDVTFENFLLEFPMFSKHAVVDEDSYKKALASAY